MVSRPLFSPQDAAELKSTRQQGFDTIELFFDDAYLVNRLDRPTGWNTGTEEESWSTIETGVGRLNVAGDGSTSIGEDVMLNITPYRFKLRRTTALTVDDELVVNGRSFVVKGVTRGDIDLRFAVATLEERHTEPAQP